MFVTTRSSTSSPNMLDSQTLLAVALANSLELLLIKDAKIDTTSGSWEVRDEILLPSESKNSTLTTAQVMELSVGVISGVGGVGEIATSSGVCDGGV